MDIILRDTSSTFRYRARAIIESADKIAIMRVDDAGYYHLPGGHVSIGETSGQTLVREIREELDFDVEIDKLVCVGERFYTKLAESIHELVFYYTVKFKSEVPLENKVLIETEHGKSKKNELFWVTRAELANLDVRPKEIKDLIINQGLDVFIHLAEHVDS